MLTTRPPNATHFDIGDSVDHPQYGRGEVVSAEGVSPARRIGVAFDHDSQPMRVFVVEASPLRRAIGPAPVVHRSRPDVRPFPRVFVPA